MNYWLDLFTGTTWTEFKAAGARLRKSAGRKSIGVLLLVGGIILSFLPSCNPAPDEPKNQTAKSLNQPLTPAQEEWAKKVAKGAAADKKWKASKLLDDVVGAETPVRIKRKIVQELVDLDLILKVDPSITPEIKEQMQTMSLGIIARLVPTVKPEKLVKLLQYKPEELFERPPG